MRATKSDLRWKLGEFGGLTERPGLPGPPKKQFFGV